MTHGYCPRSSEPVAQAAEVLGRFELRARLAPFTRCLRCNGPLAPAAPDAIAGGVPPRSRAAHDTFRQCTRCGRLYWEGTHHRRLAALVDALVAKAR